METSKVNRIRTWIYIPYGVNFSSMTLSVFFCPISSFLLLSINFSTVRPLGAHHSSYLHHLDYSQAYTSTPASHLSILTHAAPIVPLPRRYLSLFRYLSVYNIVVYVINGRGQPFEYFPRSKRRTRYTPPRSSLATNNRSRRSSALRNSLALDLS